MDHPAVASVDPHVVDRGRTGTAAAASEEEEVARLQLGKSDTARLRHLARHLRRGAPADGGAEALAAWVRLEPVDAPREPRAVEAAARPDAEHRLLGARGPAPDVRIADQVERGLKDPPLPGRVHGELELRRDLLHRPDLPAREAEDLRGRVRGLGPRGDVLRAELEVVVRRLVVLAEPEQSRDDLASEAGGRADAGGAGSDVERTRLVGELETAHEGLVELGERRAAGRSRRGGRRGEGGDEGAQGQARADTDRKESTHGTRIVRRPATL